jgi:hypothetical protein
VMQSGYSWRAGKYARVRFKVVPVGRICPMMVQPQRA